MQAFRSSDLPPVISQGAKNRAFLLPRDEVLCEASPTIPTALNEEQRQSQISSGHRLVKLTRMKRFHLYQHEEFHAKALRVPAEYWLDHFLPALRARMNETITQRVNAAIVRARTHAKSYGVDKPGAAEFVAEAFFDNVWYKIRENNVSRPALRDQIRAILARGECLNLHLPIFSRKPFSPIKNRGPFPDLAEIHSLTRCAEAAQVINALSPTGCRITVLADGFKYNRACRTPDSFVNAYQSGLAFWVAHMDIADIVNVVNYEQWISDRLPTPLLERRPGLYERHIRDLTEAYSPLFDPDDLTHSMTAMERAGDIGNQLAFTFWSIVTSVYYEDLFAFAGGTSPYERHYGDDVQRLYVAYTSSLHRPLGTLSRRSEHLPFLGYLPPGSCADLFRTMRQSAWEAAIRYVAISLTDRDLNVLRVIEPDAIKLTVHGKKGEVHFLSATQQDAAMTAQHSTGGLGGSPTAAKITFRYRLERESHGEIPILIQRLPKTAFHRARFGPLFDLQTIDQPIGYVADTALIGTGNLHTVLTRKG